jgi:hypothetical protein
VRIEEFRKAGERDKWEVSVECVSFIRIKEKVYKCIQTLQLGFRTICKIVNNVDSFLLKIYKSNSIEQSFAIEIANPPREDK